MAANIESPVTPSSTTSCSPSGFDYPPIVLSPQVQAQLYNRSVSEQQATPTSRRRHDNRQHDNQLCMKWRTALRCKQHVGTQEWVNCKQVPCVALREELHHLLDCRYRLIGGCKTRCIQLREELTRLRELEPKYATISDEQLGTRMINGQSSFGETDNDELQAKLQAVTIEEFVATSPYSPSSPKLEEPFQSRVETQENDPQRENEAPEESNLVSVVELIPLDQAKLSVSNGCFRICHEWNKVCFLGKGTFGSTYLCFDKLRGSHFAIKKLPVSGFQEDEVKLWQKFRGRHPNILDLYGAVKRDERVLIFMEYMNGGSVGDYLAKNGAFSESNALKILQQVLSGLKFMHKLRIIHGDVKAANILMDDLCLQIKLADFGSCVDLNSVETSGPQRLAGTLAFMAPEVCRSETPLPSSDIWSTMCFLIQMLSTEAPWEEYRHQGDGLLFVIGSAKRPPKLPECSEPVQDVFAQGLNVVAAERPTAAALLRHCVFNFGDEDINSYDDESDERDSQDGDEFTDLSDDSDAEYHSSHSPDTSDEYFSFDDETDNIPVRKKVKPTNTTDVKRVDSRGGHLKLTNAHVTIPAKALDANTTVAISSIDPGQYYQTIIDNGIQDKVTILGDAYKLRPSGLKFRGNVSVQVTLPEALHQSEDLRVFHGTFNNSNKLSWTVIEKPTPVLSFQDSAKVTVTINHFSILLFVKTLPSFAYEYVSTYFNFHAALFRFIVLTRREEDNSRRLKIRVVIVRDSFYLNTTKEVFKSLYICHKYVEEGYCEMFGSRREYLCPKEDFQVSIEGSFGDGICLPMHHTVQNVFGGEEVASWELDTSGDELEPISGTVVMRRDAGQKYRFQFWQHEPTRYVQDVLKLSTLRYTNMLPLARALGLNQGEVNDLVEQTGGDEEKQLQQITERWKTNAGNNELPGLRDFVASVPREAILVSDRGKSHLGHLSEFSQKWSENITNRTAGEDQYLAKMAENGENICQSVFTDCLLQTDHSIDTVRLATSQSKLSTAMERLLEALSENYPESVMKKLYTLVRVFVSYDEGKSDPSKSDPSKSDPSKSDPSKSDPSRCQQFCEHLFQCIPWLMQVVKDCFIIHPVIQPTGMWGLQSPTDRNEETEDEKSCSDVWCKISELLRDICKNNSTDSVHTELEDMGQTLNVSGFLERLSITDKAWLCLAARLRYYHRFSREIMKRKLSRTHNQDLENVLHCLQRYVSFCPMRLVHFSFPTGRVRKEPLSFDISSNGPTFSQRCSVCLEDTALDLSIKVKVFIRGSRLSAERHFTVTRCEEPEKPEESHGDQCTTLTAKYQHQWNEAGVLRITNDCKTLFHEQAVQAESEERIEETVTDGNSNELVKEGCPEDRELYEIATKVTDEWKPLGRILLEPNTVAIIEADERGVEEKTTKMFQKWKRAQGEDATYKKLYDALVDVTVGRKDIADRYCLVKRSQARDTEL